MKKRHYQQGSSLEIIIIVVLVVAIIGLLGFVFWNNFVNKSVTNKTDQSKNQNVMLPESYTSNVGRFTVNYPSNWTLDAGEDGTTDYGGGLKIRASDATLTSPSGTKLTLDSFDGGRGGTCGPKEGDVPFAAGNDCTSSVYLSVERLPIDNVYSSWVSKNDRERANIYLTTEKVGDSNELTYIIGANSDTPPYDTIEANKPVMGYLVAEAIINNYDKDGTSYPPISIYASSKTEDFLTSADAQTIKEIIRSLRINNN